MFTDTTYVVSGCIDRGAARACCCHPDTVPPEKVVEASRLPVEDQIRPKCVPPSLADFQYRIAVILPARATWNFIPSSYGRPSFAFASTGACAVNRDCD
jgi:hypothetical protein